LSAQENSACGSRTVPSNGGGVDDSKTLGEDLLGGSHHCMAEEAEKQRKNSTAERHDGFERTTRVRRLVL
jgi:hypothetical protein